MNRIVMVLLLVACVLAFGSEYNDLVIRSLSTSVRFSNNSVFSLAIGYKRIGTDYVYVGSGWNIRSGKEFRSSLNLFFVVTMRDLLSALGGENIWERNRYYLEFYLLLEWF